MILRQQALGGQESWNDNAGEKETIDFFTRRYINFCQHSSAHIARYVVGMQRDELDPEHVEKLDISRD